MPICRRTPRLLLVLATVVACGAGSGHAPDAGEAPDAGTDATPGYQATELGTAPYVDSSSGREWTNHLVRITRPDGATTYVQYIPSDKPGPRPIVVLTMPYAGIDWTGEAIDTRWAGYALTDGRHLDVDGPGFDGAAMIVYDPTPIAKADDQAHLHLLNDFAVALVYARFYTGGSVRDDIEDMRAGMWFVAERPATEIDHARIGVFGGSWGGFEALYASAYADPRARPLVTVAEYAPADFTTLEPHFHAVTGDARTFLQPYLRRIHAATGGAPDDPGADYGELRTADLCAGLPAATLVLHDEHDNLVPVAQTEALLAACGGDAVFWRRTGAIDPSVWSHGPLLSEPGFPSVSTYALDYLGLHLAPPEQALVLSAYAPDALAAHLATVHAAQLAGRDVLFAAPRLRELADPRLYLLDLTDGALHPGAEVAATAVNAIWGTHETAQTIAATLAGGLPPP
ncbi:MAG: hypothetical protein K8W52_05790 [Deltaproteobacteria bacterium]|nr:hypothetical protein [Deltaproteobacteria bacterium]